MEKLSELQIETIRSLVAKHSVHSQEMQQEIVDYMCCEIEELMSKHMSFEDAKNSTLQKVLLDGAVELEKNSIDILKRKGHQKKLIIASFVTIGFTSFSVILKLFHVPASNILILASALLLLFYLLPMVFKRQYLIEKYEHSKAKQKNIWGYIGVSIMIIGITCKLFHIPATNIVLVIGFILLNIVYLPAIFHKKIW